MKRITVTIGIPAYNEEQNIGRLLRSIVAQTEKGFLIRKIVVISDASTDRTSREVRKIRDRRVRLLENKYRIGQSASQNQLMRLCHEDVLVLLEADTVPASNDYLVKLLAPFFSAKKNWLVQGKAMCVKPCTFVGRIYSSSFDAMQEIYEQNEKLQHKICSGRGGRALAKALYTKILVPPSVPEDVYILLWSKRHKAKVEYAKEAVMYFQPSGTLSDFLNGEKKIRSGRDSLGSYFGRETVTRHYEKNTKKYLLSFAWKTPIYFVAYVLLKSFTILISSNHIFTDFWETSYSTKALSLRLS